ncbi:MAG: nucleotidyl transferase AbiEii/AbiGii toxin family protein [Deltaproteobacteria bacterium]|nr:nucleotidyl transferase AbiEii/AbiGii toxin family protein [Candidatus Tharpella aukensis]
MRLHEEEILFRQTVTATAAQLNIPEIFIEKDYWVTCALHRIFHAPIGKETVFKGGTALSKCFGLIDRFSEDIDLVVKHHKGETDNQLKRKIKKVGQIVTPILPEVEIEGLTRKMGMNRKTVHSYPKMFRGRFGQVRNVIVVEATWFGYYEPYVEHSYRGELEPAEAAFKKAIAIDREIYAAYRNLAVLYSRQQKLDQAEDILRQALALDDTLYDIHYSLGLLLSEMKNYEEAVTPLEKAAAGLPNHSRIHYNLGMLLEFLNRGPEAEKALSQAVTLEPQKYPVSNRPGPPLSRRKQIDQSLRTG